MTTVALIGAIFSHKQIVYFLAQYIREGMSSSGTVKYNIDGKYIREGMSSSGSVKFNIDGNYIREGMSSSGTVVANL